MAEYKCPKCGGEEFYTEATVHEVWYIDKNGELTESGDIIDFLSNPLDDRFGEKIWGCCKCGYEDFSINFKVKEDNND